MPGDCAHTSVANKHIWQCVAQWTPIGVQFLASVEGGADPGRQKLSEELHDIEEENDYADESDSGQRNFDEEEGADEMDGEELEELYQIAVKERPDNVELMFQKLREQAMTRRG